MNTVYVNNKNIINYEWNYQMPQMWAKYDGQQTRQ